MTRILQRPTLSCLFLGALFGLLPAIVAGADLPVKVFVLAGQSNMQGHGVVDLDHPQHYNSGRGNLEHAMRAPGAEKQYRHLKDNDGNWAVREDVWVSYQTEKAGLKLGGLGIGYSAYPGKHHIGPELQFGHRLGDHYDQQVLLIKTAWGGKSLHKDFRPPSAGGEVGPYYTRMLAEVEKCLAELPQNFPAYRGQGYEIAGFVWQQGWNDMISQPAREEYEQNLVHLIHDLRAVWKRPDLPVVVGELGNGGEQGGENMLAFRRAQAAACARPELRKTVRFVKTTQCARPANESPNRGHGHHWFGNAESYFLVGDELGKGIVELLLSPSAAEEPAVNEPAAGKPTTPPAANATGSLRPTRQPNIVVVMSDDMGFSDIGCYGGEIRTPNLDRLAEHGLRFSQFYNTARCCPTRAALLTGVYQHQAGIGLMVNPTRDLPGYRGELGRNVVTLAEALSAGGYRAYMSGKWHVTTHIQPQGPKQNWPLQRGFDKFYGTIIGAGSFYDPATLCRGNTFITPANDPDYQPETYYYTDAISDNAVAFLQQHQSETPDQPLFLYVAYTAAHWPMHALPKDIAKYQGKYDAGFEPIRQARLRRLKQLGLVGDEVNLSPQADDWESVANKAWEARNMEVYAAMIDNMDQGIGRIVSELDRQRQLDNTLFLFLQDNGGCAEGLGRSAPRKPQPTNLQPLGRDGLQDRIVPPMQTRDGRPLRTGPGVMAGPEDTFIAYGRGWANVSNTPFREYKHYTHEGGISTPLIVHWPAQLPAARRGKLEHQPGHLIDIMATCLDAAGIDYPEKYGDHKILPPEGVSLLPALAGQPIGRKDALYFEHHLNCAVRDGDWKLVRKGTPGNKAELFPWELYHLRTDRAELNNLARKQPEKVAELAAKWEAWAQRALVKPWPYDPTLVESP